MRCPRLGGGGDSFSAFWFLRSSNCRLDRPRPGLQAGAHRLYPGRSVIVAPQNMPRNVAGDPLRDGIVSKLHEAA
jgi:hypothetical protein